MRTQRTVRSATRAGSLVALALAVTLVTACGADGGAVGTDTSDGVASLRVASSDDQSANSDGASTSADDSALEAPDDPEEAFALYDQCLQEHGVDPGKGFVVAGGGDAVAVAPPDGAVTEGSGPANQVFVFGDGSSGDQPPEIDQELIDASEACRGHLANATRDFDLTPEQQAAMEDAQLEFQQCMTDHGIEGGGFSISVGDGAALDIHESSDDGAPPPVSIDPEEFQAAAEDCQKVYDDYPELDDVFGDTPPGGGVFVGRADAGGGS